MGNTLQLFMRQFWHLYERLIIASEHDGSDFETGCPGMLASSGIKSCGEVLSRSQHSVKLDTIDSRNLLDMPSNPFIFFSYTLGQIPISQPTAFPSVINISFQNFAFEIGWVFVVLTPPTIRWSNILQRDSFYFASSHTTNITSNESVFFLPSRVRSSENHAVYRNDYFDCLQLCELTTFDICSAAQWFVHLIIHSAVLLRYLSWEIIALESYIVLFTRIFPQSLNLSAIFVVNLFSSINQIAVFCDLCHHH